MENEMLNKILEEVKSLRTEMNERFENVDKKFEEMDNKFECKFEALDNKFEGKFEGLNDKFEGLNSEFKEIKKELNQLRKDFERHDKGEKMAWEDFENVIGDEFKKVNERLDKQSINIEFIKMGIEKLYLIHKTELNLAEESEKYEVDTNKE